MNIALNDIVTTINNTTVFRQGSELYRSNSYDEITIEETKNNLQFSSEFLPENLPVTFQVDKTSGKITSFHCDCGSNTTCSHIAGLFLKVLFTQKELLKPYQKKNETKKFRDFKQEMAHTSVLSLVQTYHQINTHQYQKQVLTKELALFPYITLSDQQLSLEFKIGKDKTYIIKDLSGFVNSFIHKEKYMIGTNSYTLCNEVFDDRSLSYINFLIQFQHEIIKRQLPLKLQVIDHIFPMLYQLKEIPFQNETLTFADHNPDISCKVKETSEGFELSLPENTIYIEGLKYSYLLIQNILYRSTTLFHETCHPLLHKLSHTNKLFIPDTDMPLFYQHVLYPIKDFISFPDVDFKEFEPEEYITKFYLDLISQDTFTCLTTFDYHGNLIDLGSKKETDFTRDETFEQFIYEYLDKYLTFDDKNNQFYFQGSEEGIYDIIHHFMPTLYQFGEVYISDALKRYNTKRETSVTLGVKLESNLLDLTVDSNHSIEELNHIVQAYRLKKKYYRLKDGSFVDTNDPAIAELSNMMEASGNDTLAANMKADSTRALMLGKSSEESKHIDVRKDKEFKQMYKNFKEINPDSFPIPENFDNILRDYQKYGYRWLKLMNSYHFGAILADDMGIGKTIQVLALLESERKEGQTSLVVCPASLILNWENEVKKFCKDLTYTLINGTGEQREKQIQNMMNYDVVITSYDYLKRDIEFYLDKTFYYVIIDEAQYIKNANTKNAQSIKQLNCTHRVALSGTPIENSLAELWSIFDFIMPGYLYSYKKFKDKFETKIVKDSNEKKTETLRKMVQPFILRRLKKDVLKELPEKIETTLKINFDEDEKDLYMANVAQIKKSLESDSDNKIEILAMLTKLRRICCDPSLVYENYTGKRSKVDACIELIETAVESNQKVLVFSQFTSLIETLEKECQNKGFSYHTLTGSTPKSRRQEMVSDFQNDDTQIFFISLKAGGTGLNLTSAQVVIHFDPWWNLSAQNQATDRAYRIGQHNNLQVFSLIMKDSIEEKIQELQQNKKALSDSIVNETNGGITNMSKQEILDLFNS